MRLTIAIALLLAAANHPSDSAHSFRGYTPQNAAAEAQWERKFRDLPDRDRIRENMQRLSARPHHVGSPYDKDNAEWLLAQLKSYGLDAQIETFTALFPTPKSRLLELVGPDAVHGQTAGAGGRRRPDLKPDRRATAHL